MQYFFLGGGAVVARSVRSLLANWLLALLPGLALAQAPTIVATVPTANAHNVPRTSAVQVTFDQALTAGSSAALQVFSGQQGGLRSRGTTPAVVSGSTLTYTPTPPFMPGETVSSTVTTAAAGSGGNLVVGKVVQFTVAAGVGPGEFSGGSNPAVGGSPTGVTLGDVDGDGDLDLLTANQNNTVSVRLNDGSGGFSGGSDLAVGNGLLRVVLGDVDGDGDLDILTLNNNVSGTVSVRLNNGAGVFGGGSDPAVGATPLGLAVGDVDGDGDLDLLTANYGSSTVSVRLNNGSGVFSGGSNPAVGLNPYSVEVGDMDSDGDLDLLTANISGNTVSVRLNNGAGVFGGGSNPAVGTNPVSVAVGDVDGDGDLDVLTANQSGSTVSVRLNNGSGVFSGGSDPVVGTNPFSVAVGDVDGDGDLDLLTANANSNTVSVRLNDGSGGFSGGYDPVVGSQPIGLALGDVDGDGDLDLLTPSPNTNTVSVRRNQLTPLSLTSLAPTLGLVGTSVTLTGTTFAGATSVSFNGTAQPTITNNTGTSLTVVVPAGASTGPVTVTNPGGTSNGVAFTVLPPVPTITTFLPASGPIGTSVTLTGSAFNATASQNVVFFGATRASVTAASTTSLTVTVPLGATHQNLSVTDLATGLTGYARQPFDVTLVGAATFQPKVDVATGNTPLSAATGDVTGDGKADVVVVNYDDNTVSVLRNTSTPGTVSFAPKVNYATGQAPIAVAIGDLDGDGKPDLAVTNQNSAFVSVFRNTAAGGAVGFAASVNVGIGDSAGSLAIGDVDGDGKPDLIVAGFGHSLVLVLRNTSTPGAVSFAPFVYFASGTDSYGAFAVAVGDMDGDGRPDLAVTNYSSNTVSVFRNTSTPGTVSFAAKVDLGYNYNSYSVVLGDLDGDGLPDLSMTSLTSVAVFHNTSVAGTISFATPVNFSTGQRPYAVSMGDVDGDGLPDLAAALRGGGVYVLRNESVPGTINLVTQAIVTAGAGSRWVAIGDLDGDGKPDLVTANEIASTVSMLRQTTRLLSLYLSVGTLSPAFDIGTFTYTATVGNAISSLMVAPISDNPAATVLVNGTAVVSSTYSGPIALAVGSNTITVVADGVTYTVTVTRLALPTLAGFAPASGPAGTPVVISGTRLDLVTGVRFGTGTLTTNFVAQSATSLTVLVPVVASTGLITLTSGVWERMSSATAFTYTPRPAGLVATLAPAGPLTGCLARTLTAAASSPAFATGTGFNNDVRSVVVQADGQVLVGGNFTTYNGTLGNRLVRLNPDGSRDATFATGSGFNNNVFSVAVQADGKVLVGGAFGVYNGAPASYLVRLNPNGSRDATFATGTGFDGAVRSVVVQADGKVLVGGEFTTYNGATGQSRLVRLNADGSRDATFNAGGAGFDSGVYTVAVQADGKVLAGGFFTTYNYSTASYLVRLNADGTRDVGFSTGTGPVLSVAVQADDQVLVGGSFTTYNGTPANYLVRLNAYGYTDATFSTGLGFDSSVYTVAVQADGQVLVGGNFASYNGTPASYLVRLDADGTRDAGFNATGAGFDSPVYTVAMQPDGQVLAGGVFTGYNGATGQNRLLRLNPDGSANTAPTAVAGAGFTFSPGGTTTNPLVTSATGSYAAVASLSGETSAASNAVVITACPAPTLTSLNPTAGPTGTSVTLTGTGFTGAAGVSFNSTAAVTFSVTSATTATATVPAGASTGNVTITTPGGISNGLPFTVTGTGLTIVSTTPVSNARAAAASGPVVATFNQAITVGSTAALQVFSAQRGGRRTGHSGSSTVSGSTVSFAPTFAFKPGETVQATVTTAATAAAGGSLAAARVFQFRAAAGVGPGYFGGGSAVPVGNYPINAVLGDMDGDGDLDIVTANYTDGTASVRFNDGAGHYSGTTAVAVGIHPYRVAVADVDGDGDLDILVANNASNNVSVRFNNGAGTFSGTTNVSVGGSTLRTLTMGDVDGDGDLDMLVVNSVISVRLNNGAGLFGGNQEVVAGLNVYQAVLGDIDGDGDLDMLVTNYEQDMVSVRLNDGAGNFSGSGSVAVGHTAESLALGDIDGDGDLDLVVGIFYGSKVDIRLNSGNGTFGGTASVVVGTGVSSISSYPLDVTLADVEGDGDLDLLTADSYDGTVGVCLNDGLGSFAGSLEAGVASEPTSLAVGDVDGDGDLDFVTAHSNTNIVSVRFNQPAPLVVAGVSPYPNQLSVLRNTTLLESFSAPVVQSTISQVAVFSAQAGGRKASTYPVGTPPNALLIAPMVPFTPGEVVSVTIPVTVVGTGGQVLAKPFVYQFTVAAGVGPGTFSGGSDPAVGSGPRSIAVGDVDGDGDLDMLAANAGSATVSVRFNNGSGIFSGGSDPAVGNNPFSVAVGDVDGDGDLDLFTANPNDNAVSVRLNNSLGAFSGGTDPAVGTHPNDVAVGDVDGDGDLDMLAANAGSATVSVRFNNGSGVFSGGSDPAVGSSPRSVAVGDVDGDGDLDLLAANYNSSTVSVRLNNGSGVFSGGSDLAVGSSPNDVAVGDVDGDGDLDLLTANNSDNTVSVRLNNGSGVFSGGSDLAVGTLPYSVAVGDVDGDGDLDLLTANVGSSTVSVRFNNGSGVFSGGSDPAVGNNPLGVAVGDVDGDGDLDMFAANGNSNTVSVRLNQGLADLVISTGSLASPVAVAASTFNSITVTSTGVGQLTGTTVVQGSVVVQGTLLTNCQPLIGAGSFTLAAGATLGICDVNGIEATGATGAVQVSGSRLFSDDATYVYNGSTSQHAGTGLPPTVRTLDVDIAAGAGSGLQLDQPVRIRRELRLTSGNLGLLPSPTGATQLTLLSDASGTALVVNTGTGRVFGTTATLQRHIEANTGANGYRHYASPMSGETVNTLATAGYAPNFTGAAAYNTSATPGLVTPFPTVFGYNQNRIAATISTYSTFDKGWQATLSGEAMTVGKGYSVQAPGAVLVDFTGTPFTGPLAVAGLARTGAADGWHLLGNPYPAPLDWSTMSQGNTASSNLQNMDGAVYVFQSSGPYAGTYRTYLAAAPSGNSPLIPAGSGFFLRTTALGTPGTVRFANANRVTSFGAQPAFGRQNNTLPTVALALTGTAGTDVLTLYTEARATAGVDAAYDAVKLANPSGLNLAALASTTPLAIAGLPSVTATTVVPLSLAVPAAGTYTLAVTALANFGTTQLYLRDAQAGTEQLLTAATTVSVALPAGALTTRRYSLVLRPAGALASAGSALAAQASLFPNPAPNTFTLTLPPVAGATQATATLVNALGQTISTRTLALAAGGTTATYATAGLAPGLYTLRVQAGREATALRVVVP